MEKLLGKHWQEEYPLGLSEAEKAEIKIALYEGLKRSNGGYHALCEYLRALKVLRAYPLP